MKKIVNLVLTFVFSLITVPIVAIVAMPSLLVWTIFSGASIATCPMEELGEKRPHFEEVYENILFAPLRTPRVIYNVVASFF